MCSLLDAHISRKILFSSGQEQIIWGLSPLFIENSNSIHRIKSRACPSERFLLLWRHEYWETPDTLRHKKLQKASLSLSCALGRLQAALSIIQDNEHLQWWQRRRRGVYDKLHQTTPTKSKVCPPFLLQQWHAFKKLELELFLSKWLRLLRRSK